MLRHWLQLSLTEGIGPILQSRVVEAAGSAQAACEATTSMLRNVEGIGSGKALKIHDALKRAAAEVEPELERTAKAGARLICREDEEYPAMLKIIPDPPPVLYIIGAIEPRDLNGIAMVGSRRCSLYGREQAERFAALLAGAGFTIVSGGARGIDSAAHRGAMMHEAGRTIAVLGSGIDVPYPRENESLFRQISQRGAVVSEYPMGAAPLPENFPKRNRIVSGISRGVLVIEADERSGALITARMATEDHNRAVMAIPGRVDNAMSAGPHKLIREGAALIVNLADIVSALHPLPVDVGQPDLFRVEEPGESAKPQAKMVEPMLANLTAHQVQLVEAMNEHPSDVDSLVERSGLSTPVVLQQLTLLSLKGIVKRVEGNTYVRTK